MKKVTTRILALNAIIAAVYFVLTVGFAPISYGLVQFRISEVLNLLAFVNPLLAPGIVIGCLLSNIFSQLGYLDMIFGTLGTIISVYMITRCKSLFWASICPAIGNIIVGIEIAFIFNPDNISLPLYLPLCIGSVMLGELVVVTCLGFPLFKFLTKNVQFMKTIGKKL